MWGIGVTWMYLLSIEEPGDNAYLEILRGYQIMLNHSFFNSIYINSYQMWGIGVTRVYLLSIEKPGDSADGIWGHSANNRDVLALGHGQIPRDHSYIT